MKHKSPMLGWHPPAELSAWAQAEAERRGVTLKVILTEALRGYRGRVTEGGNEGVTPRGTVMPTCPKCGSRDTLKDGLLAFMCGTCGKEWEIN